MAGLTWAQNAASKWPRTCAPDRGRRAIAAMSHRSWTPAGVPGGTTAVAGAASAAAGPAGAAGADVPGEPHAPASSTTVVLSATRSGHAGRPGLRSREPSFTVSSLPRGGPRNERHGARPVPSAGSTLSRHQGDHHT